MSSFLPFFSLLILSPVGDAEHPSFPSKFAIKVSSPLQLRLKSLESPPVYWDGSRGGFTLPRACCRVGVRAAVSVTEL